MAAIVVTDIQVTDNPCPFNYPIKLKITFECIPPGIQGELEWKLVYVGSADDEKYDQLVESVLVGPVTVGKNQFLLQANPPDMNKIPEKDVLEVTVLLLTCCYKDKEFIRVGWYVYNDYGPDQEQMALNPPPRLIPEKVWRNILADKPRVTRFAIPWDDEKVQMPEQPDSSGGMNVQLEPQIGVPIGQTVTGFQQPSAERIDADVSVDMSMDMSVQ
eukprot:804015_1